MDFGEALGRSWQINNRINLYLIQAVTDEGWMCSLTPKSRTVMALFRHMHNVRVMWLEATKTLDATVRKIEAAEVTREAVSDALERSGAAIERLVVTAALGDGRVKGFKPDVVAFASYLVSHEAHHRGQAELIMRLRGHALPDRASYGLWEWGVR